MQGIQPLVKGIGKDSGAAGKAVLRDQIVIPKECLEQTGPPLLLVEAVSSIGTVCGVGAVAVGIGIAKA